MLSRSRASRLILRQVRIVFRLLCWIAVSVGQVMVALASGFKACRRASVDYGPAVVPLQIVLLLAWVPIRLLFLALERSATGVHRTELRLRRAWVPAD